jgi:5-methylcytosine-specific restriction endonuclease McrBC GTP-binding regulatory subunit McrB
MTIEMRAERSLPEFETQEERLQSLLERFRFANPTFRISDDVIRRYHLAMSTRGFVIVSGASGTGKTWLAQAYAEAVGARAKLAAVDPSWSSNEDLLGYLSPLDGFYHHTPFSEFVQEAAREWDSANASDRPAREFHVILDEMNLARVEHYFSRFLSAMELRSRQGSARLDLAPGHTVILPPNLKFAGTVNIDETTHGFADKVYDRAQLIELPLPRAKIVEHLDKYPYAERVLAVWDAVQPIAPFGFRVLDEIHMYVAAADQVGTCWEVALDEQLVQKVLPRIRGADKRLQEGLDAFLEALGDLEFTLSRAKAQEMRQEYETHGFASFF